MWNDNINDRKWVISNNNDVVMKRILIIVMIIMIWWKWWKW